MQDIGEVVGVPKGSLYQHIDSKEALLFQIIGGSLEWTTSQVEKIGESQVAPLEKLKMAIQHHINATVTRHDSVGVLLEDAKHLSGARRRNVVRLQERYEAVIQRILEDGITAGQFRPCNVKMVSFAILGMCNWIYRWYDSEGPLAEGEIINIFTDFVLRGISLETPAAGHDGPLVAVKEEG
jgi:AcrR family transcriptional regulator